MIHLFPFEDAMAWRVFEDIDLDDRLEAALARGDAAHPLALFADWRAVNVWRATSVVAARSDREPFAVVGVVGGGAGGVAQAAMVARTHAEWRRELARLVVELRRRMPAWAGEQGISRIECRCRALHPTAARLLTGVGFRHEADLPGFAGGHETFRQFAWTAERS